jgi:hypothetical protein
LLVVDGDGVVEVVGFEAPPQETAVDLVHVLPRASTERPEHPSHRR